MLVRRTARLALVALVAMTLLEIANNAIAELSRMHYPITFLRSGFPALLALLFTLAILDDR